MNPIRSRGRFARKKKPPIQKELPPGDDKQYRCEHCHELCCNWGVSKLAYNPSDPIEEPRGVEGQGVFVAILFVWLGVLVLVFIAPIVSLFSFGTRAAAWTMVIGVLLCLVAFACLAFASLGTWG